MIIRRMVESDLDQVSDIESENFSIPWSKDSFLSSILDSNQIFLVAEEKDEVIGYCGMWNIVGEGNITNVSVKKEYQNNHIGHSLLMELKKLGEEAKVVDLTLEVRVSNAAAIHLYEKLGFESAGIRKNFYEKPEEDAIIMWYHKNVC